MPRLLPGFGSALLVFVALLCDRPAHAASGCSSSSGEPSYFYEGPHDGSELSFNPLTVLINGGFDITRNPSYTSRLADIQYGTGLENVAFNLANPQWAIPADQLGRVVAHEIIPYQGLESRYGQWIPNVLLHTIGEGMLYRKTSEWYRARCFPSPKVLGAITLLTMQMLNEVVENGAYRGPNADPVLDVYLFNTLGYLLFSFDAVAAFFSGPVQLNYWPGQPVFDLNRGVLFNHGENYAFEVTLGDWTQVRAFAYFGAEGLFGLSVPWERHVISFGLGTRLLELQVDEGGGDEATRILRPDGEMNLAGGLFLEKEHSLLASLQLGGGNRPMAAFNLYPSVLRLGSFKFGLYATGGEEEGYSAGFTLGGAPLVPGVLIAPRPESVRF